MKVRYSIDEGAFAPIRAHEWDAGWDLRTPECFVVGERQDYVVNTGIHVEIPEGYVGFIKSKSGLNVKAGIQAEGVIDAGYTGSIVVKLFNHSDEAKEFLRGDKITQLVILPIPEVEMERVEQINGSDRGNNGFGSSGK